MIHSELNAENHYFKCTPVYLFFEKCSSWNVMQKPRSGLARTMQTGSLNKIFLLFLLILVFQESPGILTIMGNIISVQFSRSVVSDYLWSPWTTARQASLSITNSQSLLKFMSIESVMPSNHLILCCPLPLLPSIFPSIKIFSNESALCIRWPKHWSFSFRISPCNEYPGLISFRNDWFDLLREI